MVQFTPRPRRTRIVATLGPASDNAEMIEKLFMAGADTFRLNFSHGAHDDHLAKLKIIRALEKEVGHPIGIIADLQGPKLRVGKIENGAVDLSVGQMIRFDLDPTAGNKDRIPLLHPEIIAAVQKDMLLLVDDGKIRMRVRETGKDHFIAEIRSGTKISDKKGVNVPGVILPIPALTEKDKIDLAAALDMGVDWIAQSFVQRPDDIAETKKLSGGHAKVIAKIEKPSALEQLDGIIELSDGIMLARGDLGVEIPPEAVPPAQKRVVRAVRMAGKPLIIATQMLESMITSASPTRAEVSDVATAIYDGADAVMLSAETASGAYPIEAVKIMHKIAKSVEGDTAYRPIMDAKHPDIRVDDLSDAVTASAHYIAQDMGATAIVTFTMSGSTALRAARQRPTVPILCLTPNVEVARRMALSYGVHPVHAADIVDFDEMVTRACQIAVDEGIAKKGERLVITAGVPFGTPGSTNVLRIAWVE